MSCPANPALHVSFVLPVYNVAPYLNRCIESLLSQPVNGTEIILVDDGSTDGSSEICDDWCGRDGRVRCVHQKNQGVSVARNCGLDVASGYWICFVDPDDSIESDVLSVSLLDEIDQDADVVLFDFYMGNGIDRVASRMLPTDEEFYEGSARDSLMSVCICRRGIAGEDASIGLGAPWSKLYRRDFLVGKELRFAPGVKMSQDILFNVDVLHRVSKVQYVHTLLYCYQQREGSSCTTEVYRADADERGLTFLQLLFERLKSYGNSELIRRAGLRILDVAQYVIKAKYMNPSSPLSWEDACSGLDAFLSNGLVAVGLERMPLELLHANQRVWLFLLKRRSYGLLRFILHVRSS